jgi:hypothetical protein
MLTCHSVVWLKYGTIKSEPRIVWTRESRKLFQVPEIWRKFTIEWWTSRMKVMLYITRLWQRFKKWLCGFSHFSFPSTAEEAYTLSFSRLVDFPFRCLPVFLSAFDLTDHQTTLTVWRSVAFSPSGCFNFLPNSGVASESIQCRIQCLHRNAIPPVVSWSH